MMRCGLTLRLLIGLRGVWIEELWELGVGGGKEEGVFG